MKKSSPKTGLVLQGYFRIERFRGVGSRAAVAQPKGPARLSPESSRDDLIRTGAPASSPASRSTKGRPIFGRSLTPQPPRPDLLPAKMRAMVGQPRIERELGGAWSGAPRPALLPGMGPSRVGPRGVAQARSSRGVSTTPIPVGQLRVIGGGRPLEPGIRQTMEAFFQADFSGVRVHEGPAAPAMGALAFTLGEELHFAPGLYDPESREGVELLGHELTHVVQQRDGQVANPYGQGVAIVQDPALEAEADRMGQRIADELWPLASVGQPSMKHGRTSRPFSTPITATRSRAIQPSSWAKIVSSTPSGGSGGIGGSGGKSGGTTTVKKTTPKLTIIITKAARKHYTHHNSQYLPTSDSELQALVLSSWNSFESQDDGSYYLDLDEYDTKRTGGVWEPRTWFIIMVPGDVSGTWVVTHFGPAS